MPVTVLVVLQIINLLGTHAPMLLRHLLADKVLPDCRVKLLVSVSARWIGPMMLSPVVSIVILRSLMSASLMTIVMSLFGSPLLVSRRSIHKRVTMMAPGKW